MTDNHKRVTEIFSALIVMGLLAYVAFVSLNVSAAP